MTILNLFLLKMPQVKFEIRDQQGLSRMGRIKWGNKNYYTPNLIFSYQEIISLSSNYTLKKNATNHKEFLTSSDFLKLIFAPVNPFIIAQVHDPLGLFSKNGDVDISSKFFPIIKENLDLYGISSLENSDLEQLRKKNELSQSEISDSLKKSLYSSIHVLSANLPNTNYDRYGEYELALIKDRFAYYSNKIFPNHPNASFILEIPFTSMKNIREFYISWINEHESLLFGLKFTNIFSNLRAQSDILEFIFDFKLKTSSNLMWIAGGDIFPQDYALAVYLGFDCIETHSLFAYSFQGLYFSTQSRDWLRKLHFPLCSCRGCQLLESNLPGKGHETIEQQYEILYHNIFTARSEMRQIEQYNHEGSLRTYLEKQIHSSPESASMLRIIDHEFGEEINSRYKLNSNYRVNCIGTESYTRPEVQNFINRVKTEIYPAQFYRMVIILPCAATKPYSQSKSHKSFKRVIRKTLGKTLFPFVHQIIITSPLGVVPRELEHIFPAAHYDIPVTGEWDSYEIKTTGELLAHWLKKYSNETGDPLLVLAHVNGGYYSAAKFAEQMIKSDSAAPEIIWKYSMGEKTHSSSASKTGLLALETILKAIKNSWEKNQLESNLKSTQLNPHNVVWSRTHHLTEAEIMVRATLDYQFGRGAGDLFLETGIIVNKSRNPLYYEVFTYDGAGKFQIGRLYTDSGFIKLTPRGAQRLIAHHRNYVTLQTTEMGGTTVFMPIVDQIDVSSHPGDDMVVINSENEYMGVGELIRAPCDLKDNEYGIVVKLRKKLKHHSSSGSNFDLEFLKEIES